MLTLTHIVSKLDIILNDGNQIPGIRHWYWLHSTTRMLPNQFSRLSRLVLLDSAQMYKNKDTLGRCKNLGWLTSTSSLSVTLLHTKRRVDWRRYGQMKRVKGEGLAKSIGASNFKASDLEEILPGAKIMPLVNQVCRDRSIGEDCPIRSY